MKSIPQRQFLHYSGIALSAAAMGQVVGSPMRKFGPNDTVSLGIIGTDMRGSGMAAELWQVSRIKVKACCDILPDRLENGLQYADKGAKGYEDQGLSPTVHALMDFANCIRHNNRPFSNEETGLHTALTVHMGNETIDKEKVIYWQGSPG